MMCLGLANGGKTPQEKIKAIYPHIVVGGDIDKPCYSIHWYDIETETMICGFSSYNLGFVRKWLQEEFEVIAEDIDDLIKLQQTQLKKYSHNVEQLIHRIDEYQTENAQLKSDLTLMTNDFKNAKELYEAEKVKVEKAKQKLVDTGKRLQTARIEAFKEFAEGLKEHLKGNGGLYCITTMNAKIDNLVKEMAGDSDE